MRFRRYFRRFLLAGAVAGAAWAPAAGAVNVEQIGGQLVPSSQLSSLQANHLVQIGGQLVEPSQLSAWQASQSGPKANRLIQIGGQLVEPSQLSAWEASQAGLKAEALPARFLPVEDSAQLRGGNSQIGGYSSTAVPESYLSKLPADIRNAYTKYQPAQRAVSSSGSSSAFDWRDTVIGLAAFVGTCAVLGAAYVTRRRTSLRPA